MPVSGFGAHLGTRKMPSNVARYRKIANNYRMLGDAAALKEVRDSYYRMAAEYDGLVEEIEKAIGGNPAATTAPPEKKEQMPPFLIP